MESYNICPSISVCATSRNVFQAHPCWRLCQSFIPFKAEEHSVVYMDHILFIHLLTDIQVVSTILAVVTYAAINMGMKIPAFNSFGYIARRRVTGSYGHPMFNFLRCYHTVSP